MRVVNRKIKSSRKSQPEGKKGIARRARSEWGARRGSRGESEMGETQRGLQL
jgi:hypothetical protein